MAHVQNLRYNGGSYTMIPPGGLVDGQTGGWFLAKGMLLAALLLPL